MRTDNDTLIDILVHGGASWRPDGSQPTTGYMVSRKGSEHQINVYEITDTDLASYEATYSDLLTNPDIYFGAWVDGDIVYLDVSLNVQDRTEAELLGILADQLAIYDVGAGQTIELPRVAETTETL